MNRLSSVSVNLKIPYIGEITGTWEPDEGERQAAWEMYVELVTRISIAELKPGEGLLREALSSLYTLFETTRTILRKYGPAVAQLKGKDKLSFGYLAVTILNTVLRPVLSKWHLLLLDHESIKANGVSPIEHERSWNKYEELRGVLNETRLILIEYTDILAQVVGISSLIHQKTLRVL